MSAQPIGIFDSGIGGLTIAHAIKQKLPNENIIYFGDTKHLPYGEKSNEAIKHYSLKIAKFLKENNCKIIEKCHCSLGKNTYISYVRFKPANYE